MMRVEHSRRGLARPAALVVILLLVRRGHMAAPRRLAGVLAAARPPAGAAVGAGREPAVGPAAVAALLGATWAARAPSARAHVVGPAAVVALEAGAGRGWGKGGGESCGWASDG